MSNVPVDYELLAKQASALLSGQRHVIANSANLCALIFQELPKINWVGFYFAEGEKLVLGPFQGKPACAEIPFGQGVCGAVATSRKPLRVDDVHAFDGHIACDLASESEIVVPVLNGHKLIAVLDIDSPVKDRFSEKDEAGICALAEIFVESVFGQIPASHPVK